MSDDFQTPKKRRKLRDGDKKSDDNENKADMNDSFDTSEVTCAYLGLLFLIINFVPSVVVSDLLRVLDQFRGPPLGLTGVRAHLRLRLHLEVADGPGQDLPAVQRSGQEARHPCDLREAPAGKP